MKTIAEVREIAAQDARQACRESLSTQTPWGGWDSWLINSGYAAEALGLPSLYNRQGDFTAKAKKLLAVYHAAADRAAAEYGQSEEFAALKQEAEDRSNAEIAAIAAQNAEANRRHFAELRDCRLAQDA